MQELPGYGTNDVKCSGQELEETRIDVLILRKMQVSWRGVFEKL